MWPSIPSFNAISSKRFTRCDGNDSDRGQTTTSEPPKMRHIESFEEKVWRKFRDQPLVPIGCAATAYFLISGIRSFSVKRDPVRSQKMMKARVAAQFLTILCFLGYIGLENADFRIAPMYQDVKKWKNTQQEDEDKQDK